MEGLGINLPTLVAQIINFVILFGLLFLVAYKPILKMLDERAAKIKESADQADTVRQQALKGEAEFKMQIEEARKEGQAILAQAVQMGEKLKEETRKEARQEAEAIIAKGRVEIQRARDEAIDELRKEFADITIMAAEKVINESLDKPGHRRLIQQVLEESGSLKKS